MLLHLFRVKGYGYTCIPLLREFMQLTYGQLETTLASHLRVHPDKLPTLRSRIKQLQRLKFPPGVNVGRGAKMEYSGEHLFMLVTAFELIGAGHPAQAACNLVTKHWGDFKAAYALAAIRSRAYRSEASNEQLDQILAVLWTQSLHEIQFTQFGKPASSELKITDEQGIRYGFRVYEHSPHFAQLVVAIEEIVRRILQIASSQAGVRTSSHDEEFHDWLPKGEATNINLAFPYPDRSNIEQRQRLHMLYGNDPESLTPEGIAEARSFIANKFAPPDIFS